MRRDLGVVVITLRSVAPNDLTYSICMQGIFPSRQ